MLVADVPWIFQEAQGTGHQAWALKLLGDIALHRDPPKTDQAEVHYRPGFCAK